MDKEQAKKPAIFERRDLLVFLGILALAGLLALLTKGAAKEATRLQIWQGQDLVHEEVLDPEAPPRELILDCCPGVVFQIDGKEGAAFIQSDCKDQHCIHMGQVKHAGDSAACLPKGLILTVVAAEDSPYDVVAGHVQEEQP